MDVREKLIEILRKPIFPHELVDPTEAVADYLLDNGVTVQEWIPVTERLPLEDGRYLVTINYFGDRQRINIRCFAKDGEAVDEYDLAGQKYVWYFYDSEYGYVSTDSVTNWMPLPQPPKGE